MTQSVFPEQVNIQTVSQRTIIFRDLRPSKISFIRIIGRLVKVFFILFVSPQELISILVYPYIK